MFLIIFGAVAATIVVLIIVALRRYRRAENKRFAEHCREVEANRSKLQNLIARTLADDREAGQELTKQLYGFKYEWERFARDHGDVEQYYAACAYYWAAVDYDNWQPKMAECLAIFKSGASHKKRVAAAFELLDGHEKIKPPTAGRLAEEYGIDSDLLSVSIPEFIHGHYERLLESARAGTNVYGELYTLIIHTRAPGYEGRRFRDLPRLEFPEDWTKLTAQHNANPNLSDFATEPKSGDLPNGRVRLMAAEALRDRDMVKAKLALAYCNASEYRRDEAGHLAGHLALMVAKMEKHQEAPALATSE
ncbi:MAG TPA: hypothetical protein VNA68_03435 [Candidatus Dormibacteraeota bacterium]|nr:hypothetical protein [Candidatus Dormibacteraeota bacterium]